MEQIHLLVKRIENHESLLESLQKNNSLKIYAAFNKSLFKLTENITELQKLKENLKQPFEPLFAKKDLQKQSLIFQYKQIIGILSLILGEKSKKFEKMNISVKKLENIGDKKLLKVVQKTITYINPLCGFSVESFKKLSSKYFSEKFDKAKKLSEGYGLTETKVQKLKNASLLFAKSRIETDMALKEQAKVAKIIEKLLDSNEQIFKNKIDKFIELYEKPESSFSKTYNDFRIVEEPLNNKPKKKKEKSELV
jgi:response regulator RpfG family c-di-GMP phosphodiesterase